VIANKELPIQIALPIFDTTLNIIPEIFITKEFPVRKHEEAPGSEESFSEQTSHFEAPADEYWPAEHIIQVFAPSFE